MPFGPICRPAPISAKASAASSTRTEKPCRANAIAAASPPIPPPAISTGIPEATTKPPRFLLQSAGLAQIVGIETIGWIRLLGAQIGIVHVERGAIGAYDLIV